MAEKGLNNRLLAAAAGVSESRISELLSGKRALSLGMIRALGSLLDIPAAVLVQAAPAVDVPRPRVLAR